MRTRSPFVLMLGLFAVGLTCLVAGGCRADAAADAQRAAELFKAHDYNGAVAAYQDLIRKYPDSPDLAAWHADLAGVYRSMHKYAECIPVLDKAIELASDSQVKKRCKIERARCYLNLDRPDDALAKYGELEKEYPNDPERAGWYHKIARYYHKKKDYANAAAWFEKCAKAETDVNARERDTLSVADALWEKGDYEKAKAIWKGLMASSNPKMVTDAYWRMIQYLRMQGKHDDALTLLDSMYETHTDPFVRARALCMKGEFLAFSLKEYDKAIPVLKRCISEYPDQVDTGDAAKEALATVLEETGRADEAVETIKSIALGADDNPAEEQARRMTRIGEIYLRNKKYSEAAKAFGDLIKLEGAPVKSKVQAAYLMADALEGIGRADEAVEALKSTVADSDSAGADVKAQSMFRIGEIYFGKGRYNEAIAVLKQFIAEYPKHEYVEGVCITIGDMLLDQGRVAEAKSWYAGLLGKEARTDKIVLWKFCLARCAYKEGDFGASRDALRALYTGYPAGKWHEHIKYLIGECCVKLGDYVAARKALEELAADYPGGAWVESGKRLLAVLAQQ